MHVQYYNDLHVSYTCPNQIINTLSYYMYIACQKAHSLLPDFQSSKPLPPGNLG